ncbi:hypothetical protein IQ218_07470 [Synechocystis salina LEGE 06099]|uniref:methionyl-tRNA formyltransferase n=1 Tax=Synechocystis salina TaxID=945780 RepID=UPI0019DC9391|nr:formyltransferase family protein [Synechocystis salina]MBE9203316.1 hypothetical protein [Synechocystis salina LEGE 06099]
MKVRAIFFCGHHSPYGMAHLQPLIDCELEITHVILANNERWNKFYESLQGKKYHYPTHNPHSYLSKIKQWIKAFLSNSFFRDKKYNKENKKVLEILKKQKIPYFEVFDVNERSSIELVIQLKPDLIISAAYPQIFSKDLISLASRGSVNFHPSLLPKYRGAHPHFWAIAKGEKNSGITAHFMTENLDDGAIIEQIEFPIQDFNYYELYDALIYKTPELIQLVSDFFCFGNKKAIAQDLSKVSYFRNDREIHHKIFWNIHNSEEIKDLVRTQRAYCFLERQRVDFWEVELKKIIEI